MPGGNNWGNDPPACERLRDKQKKGNSTSREFEQMAMRRLVKNRIYEEKKIKKSYLQ